MPLQVKLKGSSKFVKNHIKNCNNLKSSLTKNFPSIICTKSSDKLTIRRCKKMFFTAAQILYFIYKSFDVLHVEIFYAAEKKSYLKNQKKNILWRMKILFYVQNFIIIIIFLFGYEWMSEQKKCASWQR